jgi:methylmalonyl-CoA/ethylmalonyl-CoA epimerase
MNGLPFHHYAVAVPSLEEAIAIHAPITGATPSAIDEVPSQGVRVVFLGTLELIQPLSPDSSVARFLERRGTGLHHVAYATVDLEAELARLAADGVRLIDERPRTGAFGHRVAFIHPSSTGGVLVELVEEHPPRR